MMLFSTLWALDRTVDPDTGRSPIADAIAAHWNHDIGSVRMFRSSANFIYTMNIAGERAYLRMAMDTERVRRDIDDELAILDHITGCGIPVVRPIAAINGALAVSCETTIGTIHAVVFAGLPGIQRELKTLSLDDLSTWGAAVGRLHGGLQFVPSALNRKTPAWKRAIACLREAQTGVPEPVKREAYRLSEWLDQVPRNTGTYGLLHNDLELDNLVWNEGGVAALDFDEYGSGWYMLDIAKALADLTVAGDRLGSPRIDAFLSGYRTMFELSDDMAETLPTFRALVELVGYASLYRAINLDAGDAEVDWMRNLIVRLRTMMRDYEVSLESPVYHRA